MKNFIQGIALAACLFGLASYQNAPNALSGAVVSADKMNVLFLGVNNPIAVLANGVAHSDLVLTCADPSVSLQHISAERWIVRAANERDIILNLTHKKTQENLDAFRFRVKRIPNPTVKITNPPNAGLIAVLHEEFPFADSARCMISYYTLFYTKKRQDPAEIKGQGGRFADQMAAAYKGRVLGDQFCFKNIYGLCPGDEKPRLLNDLAFVVR